MGGRPEATDGGYHEFNDDYSQEAWQAFTPWRPGDPSTAGEAPPSYAAGQAELNDRTRSSRPYPEPEQSHRRTRSQDDEGARGHIERPGRWWAENVPEKYERGDRVRNNTVIRGKLGMQHVPDNTKGQVVSTRFGLLGGEYVTVRFENGYTEEVKIAEIERRSWWE